MLFHPICELRMHLSKDQAGNHATGLCPAASASAPWAPHSRAAKLESPGLGRQRFVSPAPQVIPSAAGVEVTVLEGFPGTE